METKLDLPFAIIGHSFGALVAYQWVKKIKEKKKLLPLCLFVSAFTCPSMVNSRLAHLKSRLNEIGLLDAFFRSELTPEQVNIIVENKIFSELINMPSEIIPLYMKIAGADTKIVESYHQDGQAVPCDITAFFGSEDNEVSESDMRAWKTLTEKEFHIYEMKGGHLYINDKRVRDEMIKIIREYIDHEK